MIIMPEDYKRINRIFRTLRPYVNGKLITCVFERLFDELEELVEDLQFNYDDYMMGDV